MWKEYSTKTGGIGFHGTYALPWWSVWAGYPIRTVELCTWYQGIISVRTMILYKETTLAVYLDFLDCTLTEPLYCNWPYLLGGISWQCGNKWPHLTQYLLYVEPERYVTISQGVHLWYSFGCYYIWFVNMLNLYVILWVEVRSMQILTQKPKSVTVTSFVTWHICCFVYFKFYRHFIHDVFVHFKR